MKRLMTKSIFLTTAALVSGCTTHLQTSLDGGTPANSGTAQPISGIPYRLPERQITVEARWTLDSCKIDPATGDITIGFENAASFSEAIVEGPRLVIDYMNMTSRFKTGQADVSFWKVGEGATARQTGFIKSFNGEIKGEEPEALKAGIGAVASAAKLALSFTGALPAAGNPDPKQAPPPPKVICNPALFDTTPGVQGAIELLKAGKLRLKKISEEAETATARLALIRARTVSALTPADQADFDKLNKQIDSLATEKKIIESTSATFRQQNSHSRSVLISDFSQSEKVEEPIVQSQSANFVKIMQPQNDSIRKLAISAITCNAQVTASECKPQLDSAIKKIEAEISSKTARAKFALLANIQIYDTAAADKFSLGPNVSYRGLVYREPAEVTFWISEPAVLGVRGEENIIIKRPVTIPQIGRMILLPLRSRFGEKNGLIAEFDQDGRPNKITYKAYESGGKAAAENLKFGLDEAGSLVNSVRLADKAKKAEADGAELAALKNRIALLTEQQKEAELLKEPSAEQQARNTELQLLRFEKERAELRKAIAEAQKP
jgi:Spy/CpxP family protein refolding chaperone